MTKTEAPLPGARALGRYIEKHYGSVSAFARAHRFDQSELNKLIQGTRQRVSVNTASQIERATKGAVGWKLWIR